MNNKAVQNFSSDQRQFKTVNAMVEHGARPFTVKGMAKVTGRDPLTIRNNLHALADAGYVKRLGRTVQQEGRGRPDEIWAFKRNRGQRVKLTVEPLTA